ncbi:Uu.00g134190.m01.CDS01 [Anthostomella pinea]|uniref:Uu.00g134190.m01.CDS01 n=1 Tax=Anthostomella pinea TaxID=933095 RepID=A0AAI8VIG3_9PEZI|nr:Uu.00g134190.m01.CDS01 [Anthostomella pinea]
MECEPINAGPMNRMLTLLSVKLMHRCERYLSRLWKPSPGSSPLSRFFIKVYPFENLAEAYAMQFVAKHTSIPVPKVYCAFIHKGATYTVMSRIDGHMVSGGWHGRSDESKREIHLQLQLMIEELRNISPPEGMGVANVNGGPFCDPRLPSKMFWGPFASVREFHQALIEPVKIDKHPTDLPDLPDDIPELLDFYRQHHEKVVFTHGDLSSLNIVVRGDKVTGIIDWETSGWFPSYWEHSCAWHVNPYNVFWQDEVGKFLPHMPYELRMDKIRLKYFDAFGTNI